MHEKKRKINKRINNALSLHIGLLSFFYGLTLLASATKKSAKQKRKIAKKRTRPLTFNLAFIVKTQHKKNVFRKHMERLL